MNTVKLQNALRRARENPVIVSFGLDCPELITIAISTMQSALDQHSWLKDLSDVVSAPAGVARNAAFGAARAERLNGGEIAWCMEALKDQFLASNLGKATFPHLNEASGSGAIGKDGDAVKIVAFTSEFRHETWSAALDGLPSFQCLCIEQTPEESVWEARPFGNLRRSPGKVHVAVIALVINGRWTYPLRVRGICIDEETGRHGRWLDGVIVEQALRLDWKRSEQGFVEPCIFRSGDGGPGSAVEEMFFLPLCVLVDVISKKSEHTGEAEEGKVESENEAELDNDLIYEMREWALPYVDVIGLSEYHLNEGLVVEQRQLDEAPVAKSGSGASVSEAESSHEAAMIPARALSTRSDLLDGLSED